MPLAPRLLGYIELARPHNVLVAVINGLVGAVTAWWLLGGIYCTREVLNALLSIALVSAGGYAINDYFDADIDRLNKPWRPIPSGRVTPGEAYFYSLVLFAAGVYCGFQASLYNGLYAAIVAALLYLYPYWMKRRRALLGHLTVAATGASTIVYGGLAVLPCAHTTAFMRVIIVPAAYAFTLIIAREFVKALEDYEGDAARGAATIATVYGQRLARIAAISLLLCIAITAPLPSLLGPYDGVYLALALVVAMLSVYSAWLVAKGEYPQARRALKIAFGVGGLAFLLDPLYAIIA